MIIKNYFLILAFSTLVLVSCKSEKDFVFSLQGKLLNIYPGNVLLYKATDLNRKQYDIMDTLFIESDSTFSAFYNLEPHHYILSLYDSMNIFFIADSGQQIKIVFPSEGGYKIYGSTDTELFEQYEKFRIDVLKEKVYPVRGRLYELMDKNDPADAQLIKALGEQVVLAEDIYRDTLLNAVKNMGTSIAIYPTMVRWNGDKHIKFYEQLAKRFTDNHQGLEVAKLVSEKIRILKQVSLGGKVSDILARDTSDVEISLYENLGKYTLIDFWGSWCAPCRLESRHLVKMYDKYKDLGFEIFGFGVEGEKDKWIRAITKDNRTWLNVSTLNSYSNEISAEYSITSLPKNFLVNEKGIILAKDVHGKELEKKLKELFSDI